jgi:hypothetical protein
MGTLLFLIGAAWLMGRVAARAIGGGTEGPRPLAEHQLVQMYLLAANLRERYLSHEGQGSQLASIEDLNASADRMIREQFEMRPHLRADDERKHETLLQLGARLCQELNDMLLIRNAEEAHERLRKNPVSAKEIEPELHGYALRRLRAHGKT